MKKLLTILLLTSNSIFAQSSFFAGVQGGVFSTTLLNQEDKSAPKSMLDKKNGIQPGFGIQLGYSLNRRVELSIEPNYLQYKIGYSGKSDTANVRSFDATLRMRYYQIPLVLTYKHPISERLSMLLGVGASYNYMSYYREDFEGVKTIYNMPSQLYSENSYVEGSRGYSHTISNKDIEVDIKFSSPLYVSQSYSILSRMGVSYALTDRLNVDFRLSYLRGVSEIENRDSMVSTVTYRENGFISESKGKYWTDSKYYRYYVKNLTPNGERVGSFTQAIGMGIGLHYYFKGSNEKR